MRCHVVALAVVALAAGVPAASQHTGHVAGAGDLAPSTEAFVTANEAMHQGMMIEYTGDPDIDFARSMIPHHRGAIDMAKAELAYGDDPEMRALAEGIIAAQEAEIARLEAWLAAHGG